LSELETFWHILDAAAVIRKYALQRDEAAFKLTANIRSKKHVEQQQYTRTVAEICSCTSSFPLALQHFFPSISLLCPARAAPAIHHHRQQHHQDQCHHPR
jgi:hypothetical protein